MMWHKSRGPSDPITAPPSKPPNASHHHHHHHDYHQSLYDWSAPGDGCPPRTLTPLELSYDSPSPSLRAEPTLVFHLRTATFSPSSPPRGQAGPQSEAFSVSEVEWGWRLQAVILSKVQLKSGIAFFKPVSGFVLRESSRRKPSRSVLSFAFFPSRMGDVLKFPDIKISMSQ